MMPGSKSLWVYCKHTWEEQLIILDLFGESLPYIIKISVEVTQDFPKKSSSFPTHEHTQAYIPLA